MCVHTRPVCYLCNRSSSQFQPIITQKSWCLFLPILHIIMPSYTVPYIPNLKGISPAIPEIQDPETCVFLILLLLCTKHKVAHTLCSCAPISIKFGTQVALSKSHISKKFGSIYSETDENTTSNR